MYSQNSKLPPRLNNSGTNFHIWKAKVGFVLIHHRVNYVFTNPKPPVPANSTPPNVVANYHKWIADDVTARHIILGTLHENLYICYHQHETAESLMDALTLFFTKPCMLRRMALFKSYVEETQGGG